MKRPYESPLKPFRRKQPIDPLPPILLGTWEPRLPNESKAKTERDKALDLIDGIISRSIIAPGGQDSEDEPAKYKKPEAEDMSNIIILNAAERAKISLIKQLIDEKQQGKKPYKRIDLAAKNYAEAAKDESDLYFIFEVSLYVHNNNEIIVIWHYIDSYTVDREKKDPV